MCGNPVEGLQHMPTIAAVPGVQTPPVIAAVHQETGVSTKSVQHPTVSSVPNAYSHWDPANPIPLRILYNACKTFRKGCLNSLDFQVLNATPVPFKKICIDVRSHLTPRPLREETSLHLMPGASQNLFVPGFSPEQVGSDVLKIALSIGLADGGTQYLQTTCPVKVEDAETPRPRQDVTINISSQGPLNVDMEDALSQLNSGHEEMDRNVFPAANRWEPLAVLWDVPRMEREARCFPSACVSPELFPMDSACRRSLSCQAAENAPKAAFSTSTGQTFILVGGTTLCLGRRLESNHVQCLLQPAQQFGDINARISRDHCRIYVRDNRVYLRDISSGGVFVDGKRLPRNEDVMLSHGEVVSVARVLDMKIRLFTDGLNLNCVQLVRLNNQSRESYILASGPVPFGSERHLPLSLLDGAAVMGAIYHHPPSGSWRLKQPHGAPDGAGDAALERFQEFTFGSQTCWFSAL